jgi:hypothetical protein
MVLGLKVTVIASVAVSFGGVMSLYVVLMTIVEILMKNSDRKYIDVWCGAALLWRPGGKLPHSRVSAYALTNHFPGATREVRILPSTLFGLKTIQSFLG